MARQEELADAHTALKRFGLGPRPGEAARIAAGPRDFVLAQLDAARLPLDAPGLPTTVEGFAIAFDFKAERKRERQAGAEDGARKAPTEAQPQTQMQAQTREERREARREARQAARANGEPRAGAAGSADPDAERMSAADAKELDPADAAAGAGMDGRAQTPNPIRAVMNREIQARLDRSVATDQPFLERLTTHWANHFCVSAKKRGFMKAVAGAYEREAIRPHVLGRFRDMLGAVLRHPAMLIYLDNFRSIGPSTRAAQRNGRGLNENLARELLELHTLGAGSGYSQADVTQLAKALTGWSITWRNDPPVGAFRFYDRRHEPGAVTVLGRRYDRDGLGKAEAILDDLARHPATARNVATRFARHFVGDPPPPALVNRLAETFRKTDGDLKALAEALVRAPEAWAAPARKVIPPWDMLVATSRATGVRFEAPAATRTLELFGQRMWEVPSPAGWPDADLEWAAPDALLERLDFAVDVGSKLAGQPDVGALAEDLLGPSASRDTLTAIRRAEDRTQAIALLIMAPEFQRR